MWLRNRQNEISVQAYNEVTERKAGGLVGKSTTTPITLCVLWIPSTRENKHDKTGKYIIERADFQISLKELENQNFTIEVGVTHIIRNNYDYKVFRITDATFMNGIQLMEVELRRLIPVRGVI